MNQPNKKLPIVFKFNNRDSNHAVLTLAFNMLRFLMLVEDSNIKNSMDSLNLFTESEFKFMVARISDIRNKDIEMNEKHLVIFYTVIHLIIKVLNSEHEMNIFNKMREDENVEKMSPTSQAILLDFIVKSQKDLKSDFKKNHFLSSCLAKINAC